MPSIEHLKLAASTQQAVSMSRNCTLKMLKFNLTRIDIRQLFMLVHDRIDNQSYQSKCITRLVI
jgi:hypothetical protein